MCVFRCLLFFFHRFMQRERKEKKQITREKREERERIWNEHEAYATRGEREESIITACLRPSVCPVSNWFDSSSFFITRFPSSSPLLKEEKKDYSSQSRLRLRLTNAITAGRRRRERERLVLNRVSGDVVLLLCLCSCYSYLTNRLPDWTSEGKRKKRKETAFLSLTHRMCFFFSFILLFLSFHP